MSEDEGTNGEKGRWPLTRRTVLSGIGSGLALSLAAGVSGAGQASEPWTVVALPDTQYYAERSSWTQYAADQTQWIADNVDAENIVFVTHEGDVVQNGGVEAEYQRMDGVMDTLDGVVPYSVVPGNHDWSRWNYRSSSTALYEKYFGESRFSGYSWFGGTGPGDSDLNSYQRFSAGGYEFLHLALEWEPRGSVDDPNTPLGWGKAVLDQHAGMPTILTTHSYLTEGGRMSSSQVRDGTGNTGQQVWEKLVRPNPQIFMVLNGHFHVTDGEYHQVSQNAAGEPVYEMLADYQSRPNGGNGWLRLVRFQPGGGSSAPDRIRVQSYSPSLDRFMTDGDSQFSFDLDFDARFGSDGSGGGGGDGIEQATFQQGQDGYVGTVDTNLLESTPGTSYADATSLTVDAREPQDTTNVAHALLRFDSLFGSDDGQVPPGATVETATLRFQTVDGGSGGAFHRLLVDWDEGATWASAFGGNGVQADGSEAVSSADARTGAVSTGTTTVDVTGTVQAWADGATNHGWAILPLGDDGWDFTASEGGTPPRLTVNYRPGAGSVAGDADGDGDVDGDDVALIQRDIAGQDVDIDRAAADMNDDGKLDITDAVAVDNAAERE